MTCINIFKIDYALELIDALAADCPEDVDLFGDVPGDTVRGGLSGLKGSTREESAIRACLTSSQTLLRLVRKMHDEPVVGMPALGRVQRLNHLVEEAKAAGRSSYRAALLLTGMDAGDESKQTLLQHARREHSRILDGLDAPAA